MRQGLVGALGAALTAALALLASGVFGEFSEPVIVASSWAWKAAGLFVVLYLAVSIVRRRRAAAPASAATALEDISRPPEPRQRPPIPQPPAPYMAHPLVLPPHFTGRFAEREALTDWFRKKRSRSVHILTGPGGTGKSALVWVWAQRDLLDRDLPQLGQDPPDMRKACRVSPRSRPDGIMWWSFDRPRAGFTVFLDEALAYLSGGTVRSSAYLSSRSQKLESLLTHLRENRFLLILDGFERELRAFSSLQADYQGDRYTAGPRGGERVCTDLHAAEFLRRIVSEPMPSRVLMTSRLLPAEFGDPAAGGIHRELGGLATVDAVSYLQSMGIKGETGDIEKTCAGVGCHALALRLLAGLILGTRASGRIKDVPRLATRGDGTGHHDVVEAALDALGRDTVRLLSNLAAFRRPITAEQVTVINPLGKEGPWPNALQELVARGILIFDAETERFDMHPILRQHAYDRLADRVVLHKRLAEYFAQVRAPVQINCLEDLEPTIELYHHLIGAERYDEACALLAEKISTPLRDRLSNQQMHMRLLRGLFDDVEGTRPLLKKKMHRAWALDALARAYSYSGETRRAAVLCRDNLASVESRGDRHDRLVLLGDLAGVQSRLGCIEEAEASLRTLVELTHELDLQAEEAVARNRLGLLLAHRGAFDESLIELDAAFETTKETADRQTQGVCFCYYTQRALLMGDPEAAFEAAQKARAFVEEIARRTEPDEHDFVRSGWLIGASLVALAGDGGTEARARRDEAERYLTDALARCRRADLVGFEPDLLLTWAKWHQVAGRDGKAVEIARDALAVADRCEYRLKQAEIHNFLAGVAMKKGDRDQARASAKIARERALCDGHPAAYQPALEEAQKCLAELGEHGPAESKAA